MPTKHFVVRLDTTEEQELIPNGAIALSMVETNCTPGARFRVKLGKGSDWSGTLVGRGEVERNFIFGAGLLPEDLRTGVYVRADVPTPGGVLVVDCSYGAQR